MFVFNPGFGKETVTDFTPGAVSGSGQVVAADVLAFDHTLFANASSVMSHARQVGADTLITYDNGDIVTLRGVTLNSLHASDFVFV
ncbi:MAG: hypothetical protein JWQ97_945 [Phenylobacterium sp.]|nr:hypothetical protein [Phenylobacterium sp.]